MSTAGDIAQANVEKEKLARELENVVIEIRQLEKKEKYLKAQLDPMMQVGERVGLVEKIKVDTLVISDALLEALEKELGSDIVRRDVNTKNLREKMAEDPELDRKIPRQSRTQFKVG